MKQYSDVELLIIEKFTEVIGDRIDLKVSSQWDKDKLIFATCINDKEKEIIIKKEIKKTQKKLSNCSSDIAGFLLWYINPSKEDLNVSSGYGFRFNLIRNFLFQEFGDALEVLSRKFKVIEDVENIDFIEWEEMIDEGFYGIDNKFMSHFIKNMANADKLITFKSFIEVDISSVRQEESLPLESLFKPLLKLNELSEKRDAECRYRVNAYGNDDFTDLYVYYDIEMKPYIEQVRKIIHSLYKVSIKLNYYFFDCPFEVYKKHYKKRRDQYFQENIDATQLDFLLSEVDYFSNPEYNRVFTKKNESFYYNSYFLTEDKYLLSLKRKFEFLNEKLKAFNRKVDFSFLETSPLKYTNINVLEIQNGQNTKNPMLKDSTWDYPLSKDYKWYELILNLFSTQTDIQNPLDYFKTEYHKRSDVFPEKRFFSLCLEYINKVKIEFMNLQKNKFNLPDTPSDLAKQILDSKNIINKKNLSLFSREKVEIKAKIKVADFNKAISSLEFFLNITNDIQKKHIKVTNTRLKYQSFTYINNLTGQTKLTDLMNALKRKNLIENSTDLKDFRKVFSGLEIEKPIVWTGNISELSYFIKKLHNELKLVVNLKQQHWAVTINCFVQENGEQYNRTKLRTQKVPTTSKNIDSTLNTLK